MKLIRTISAGTFRCLWGFFIIYARYLRVARISRYLVLKKLNKNSYTPYPFRFRELIDSLLPTSILWKNNPAIEIVIPSTAKDAQLLNLIITAVRHNSLNPIGKISVICPARDLEEIKAMKLNGVDVINEENLLGKTLTSACDDVAPVSSKGWVRQQAVKFAAVLQSDYSGVLVLDSDTVILSQHAWLSREGRQSLAISHEYHVAYQKHFEKFLESKHSHLLQNRETRLRVSFVTHYQLMQPYVLRNFLAGGAYKTAEVGLLNWIRKFDFADSSPASEFHCYGTFISTFFPERIQLIHWGNKAVPRKEIASKFGANVQDVSLQDLQKAYPHQSSISLHAYL